MQKPNRSRATVQKLNRALRLDEQLELRSYLSTAEHPGSVELSLLDSQSIALKLAYACVRLSRSSGAPLKSDRASTLQRLCAAGEAPGIDSPLRLSLAQAQRAAAVLAQELVPSLRRPRKGRPGKFSGSHDGVGYNTLGILALALALRPGTRTDTEAVCEALLASPGASEASPHLEHFLRRFSEFRKARAAGLGEQIKPKT